MADSSDTTAIIIATGLLSLVSGYMLGVFSSLGFLPIPFLPNNGPNYHPRRTDESEEESEEEEVDEDILDHAPSWKNDFAQDVRDGLRMRGIAGSVKAEKENEKVKEQNVKAGREKEKVKEESVKTEEFQLRNGKPGEECKLVLVVRTDLGMTKGKIAAQASHATLACYKKSSSSKNPTIAQNLKTWEKRGQAKIAVQCKSEDEMFTLQATARSLGLVAEVIADAGRTQIEAGSYTVLGIGPAPKSLVDVVTGGLKLL